MVIPKLTRKIDRNPAEIYKGNKTYHPTMKNTCEGEIMATFIMIIIQAIRNQEGENK